MDLHYDLCKKTAQWQCPKNEVVLYEYQSFATFEFPDVIAFKGGGSILFEIKVDYQDFKKDSKKYCRKEFDVKYFGRIEFVKDTYTKLFFGNPILKEFIKQHPHLGRERYYVCPVNLIKPNEIENGFGLYYYSNGKFYKKKNQQILRRMFLQKMLYCHTR